MVTYIDLTTAHGLPFLSHYHCSPLTLIPVPVRKNLAQMRNENAMIFLLKHVQAGPLYHFIKKRKEGIQSLTSVHRRIHLIVYWNLLKHKVLAMECSLICMSFTLSFFLSFSRTLKKIVFLHNAATVVCGRQLSRPL